MVWLLACLPACLLASSIPSMLSLSEACETVVDKHVSSSMMMCCAVSRWTSYMCSNYGTARARAREVATRWASGFVSLWLLHGGGDISMGRGWRERCLLLLL